jgi:ATP-dependent DNA helicase DinG
LTSAQLYEGHIENFEERPQQLEMAFAVANAFNNQEFLLAEAGTGTGKSLAYLLPAALLALGSGQQVGISTHTINLQEQLMKKDIPQLRGILNKNFSAAVLKGRNNYLCLNLFRYFCANAEGDLRDFMLRLLVWLHETASGDGGELGLSRYDAWKWQLVCASSENCQAPACSFCNGRCLVNKSRREAENADMVVINNSLLVADAAMERGVLPELSYLIIDEAHHLHKAAENQLSAAADFYGILQILSRLQKREKGKSAGILAQIQKQGERLLLLADDEAAVERYILAAEEEVAESLHKAEQFFSLLQTVYHKAALAYGYYPARLLMGPKDKESPYRQEIEALAQNLYGCLRRLAKTLLGLFDLLLAIELQSDVEIAVKDQLKIVAALLGGSADVIEKWVSFIDAAADDNYVMWLEFAEREKWPSLHIAPLELGQILYDCFFSQKTSVVMTSATLSAAGSFAYFKKNLGLDLLPQPVE